MTNWRFVVFPKPGVPDQDEWNGNSLYGDFEVIEHELTEFLKHGNFENG